MLDEMAEYGCSFAVMLLILACVIGCCAALPRDPDVAMDRVMEVVSGLARKSYPLDDWHWEAFSGFFQLSLDLKDVSFWNAATPMRLGPVTVGNVSDQTRVEVTLMLATMRIHYGSYRLHTPFRSFEGAAEFRMDVNNFGVTAYFGDDCNRTRVYIWQPRGNPSLHFYSESRRARWIESAFNYLASGIIQNLIDFAFVGDSLNLALSRPLTEAIGSVFCAAA